MEKRTCKYYVLYVSAGLNFEPCQIFRNWNNFFSLILLSKSSPKVMVQYIACFALFLAQDRETACLMPQKCKSDLIPPSRATHWQQKSANPALFPHMSPGSTPPGWPLISALNLSSELKVQQIFMIFIVSWYNPVQFAHSICQHSLKMFLIYYYFYGHVRLLPSTRLCLIILCNNNLLPFQQMTNFMERDEWVDRSLEKEHSFRQ